MEASRGIEPFALAVGRVEDERSVGDGPETPLETVLERLQEVERGAVHLRDDPKGDRRLRQIGLDGSPVEELRRRGGPVWAGSPASSPTRREYARWSSPSGRPSGRRRRRDVEQGAEAAGELEAERGRER